MARNEEEEDRDPEIFCFRVGLNYHSSLILPLPLDTMPPRPQLSVLDYAHRAFVWGCVGLTVRPGFILDDCRLTSRRTDVY
jgi:hypothetical protein